MKPIQLISQDLFDKVRSRFTNLEMGDETGAVTIDPAEARFFDFDFVNEGVDLGRVSISLNDLGSLKIYYSQGITENQDDNGTQMWYNFLKEMRLFAMRRLLRFDTRDIAKTNLDKNDFQHLAATQGPKEEPDMNTMNETKKIKKDDNSESEKDFLARQERLAAAAAQTAQNPERLKRMMSIPGYAAAMGLAKDTTTKEEVDLRPGRDVIATGTPDAIKLKIKELGLGTARRESTGSGGEAIFVFRNPNYYVSQGQDGAWVLVQTNTESDQQGVAEGWKDEADDFTGWSNHVKEKLSKAAPEQRLGIAKQLSQIEVKNFGSTIQGGFNRQTGKAQPGLGLTDTVRNIFKSFSQEQQDIHAYNTKDEDGKAGTPDAGKFQTKFGSIFVYGMENATQIELVLMGKAVRMGPDYSKAAQEIYRKTGTLTVDDLKGIRKGFEDNANKFATSIGAQIEPNRPEEPTALTQASLAQQDQRLRENSISSAGIGNNEYKQWMEKIKKYYPTAKVQQRKSPPLLVIAYDKGKEVGVFDIENQEVKFVPPNKDYWNSNDWKPGSMSTPTSPQQSAIPAKPASALDRVRSRMNSNKGMAENTGREMTNTPRDRLISRMSPSVDNNALLQKVGKVVNSPEFDSDAILKIVDAGDTMKHPVGRYIQKEFDELQYDLGRAYEDHPEEVAEKLLAMLIDRTQQGVAEGDYADGSSIKTPGSEDWKQQYQQAVMAVKNAKTQQEYEAASDRAGRIKDLLASKGIQVGAVLGQQGVAEGYDSEELANEVYSEFERIYPNLARRADERTIHAAIMDVLNYGGDSNPSALAQDVARAVKQEMQQGVAEGEHTMNESRWNHKSSSKTSRAVQGKTEVVVRHVNKVAETYPGARSQNKNIKAIFIQNADGERAKYPFIHLAGAFAMAQHVDHGGVPHDPAGKAIIKMSEHIAKLGEFQRHIQLSSINADAHRIAERAIGHMNELKARVAALGKRHHYEAWREDFEMSGIGDNTDKMVLDAVTLEDYKSKFTQTNFQEELVGFFPLLHSIMREANTVDLEEYVSEQGVAEVTALQSLGGNPRFNQNRPMPPQPAITKEKSAAEGSHEDQVARLAAYNEKMAGKNPPIDLGLREVGNWAKVGHYGDPIKTAWFNIAKYGIRNNKFNDSVDRAMLAIGDFPDKYDLSIPEIGTLYSAYETVYDQWEQSQGQQGVAEVTALQSLGGNPRFNQNRPMPPQPAIPKEKSAAESINAFEEWADAKEKNELTSYQMNNLKTAIEALPQGDQGPQLDAEIANDFFNDPEKGLTELPNFDKLTQALQDEEVRDEEIRATPLQLFQSWAKEYNPDLLAALGMTGGEELAPEAPPAPEAGAAPAPAAPPAPEQPVAEGKSSMVQEVAKIVKSFYNADNESVGPFRAEENIALDCKKQVTEKFGEKAGEQAYEMAEAFINKLTQEWQEKHGKIQNHGPVDQGDGFSVDGLKEILGRIKQKVEGIGQPEMEDSKKDFRTHGMDSKPSKENPKGNPPPTDWETDPIAAATDRAHDAGSKLLQRLAGIRKK